MKTSACFLGILLPLLSATAAHAVSSAELYTADSYQYGRFEASIRFAGGDGVVSSFFLWKDGSEKSGTFWNELDFEKLGADCHLQTNALFGLPLGDHGINEGTVSNLCGGFHTYAYEWTPDYISWSVDGMEVRRETGATATAYAENATAGMQIRFNIWPGDASFGGSFSPSILPVHEFVDWVQYASYADDGTFTPEWREDFNENTMPSGWNAGSWGSPKNLSTHNTQNVTFVDGHAVLSLTADDALGFTGSIPKDDTGSEPNGSDEDSGGCSFGPARAGHESAAFILAAALAAVTRRRAKSAPRAGR
jgi:prepilin-type processing-associated H-X9-DG protein